jgi:hypothetical protein
VTGLAGRIAVVQLSTHAHCAGRENDSSRGVQEIDDLDLFVLTDGVQHVLEALWIFDEHLMLQAILNHAADLRSEEREVVERRLPVARIYDRGEGPKDEDEGQHDAKGYFGAQAAT